MATFFFLHKNFEEIEFVQMGMEECSPNHVGNGMRKNYLVHFIVSGKGMFTIDNKTYELEAGQSFLIPADVMYFYKADSEDPWHYMWFEINGSGARSLLQEIFPNDGYPIYTTESTVYIQEQFLKMLKAGENRQILLVLGALYNLIGNMVLYNKEQRSVRPSGGKNYVDTAIKYIENNYFKKITISEICSAICIERSYLCRLFKKYTGLSPQQYIIDYRMNLAKELLSSERYSVSQVAVMVGYEDRIAFSKLFRKHFSVSPKNYTKLNEE